ncbi:signal peptidase I [Salinirubellus salinus]|uniref:Signal peptidase I n=1 Tax=Salinirubellus salinus TaxID=1364945 RepID=A0A9E7R1D6_9EURY|nr:signal peptidase I [Salinirubellus salinus]UWM53728.1 signal peptidase I [Salinirubellus salinus]
MLVSVALSIVAGAVLGQPTVLGFVETGSMAPTLDPGDGFVAVPSDLTEIEEGDVITFHAEEIQGGGLTTHRVVGETDRGYVTRGDANPFTDQQGGEPPVRREQVVAEALQVGGSVVVVPHLGTAVEGVQGALGAVQRGAVGLFGTRALLGPQWLGYLFFGATLVYYLLGEYRDRNERGSRERSRGRDTGIDPRVLLLGFALVLAAAATAAMAGPAGPKEFGVVSAEFDSERPDVIRAGGSSDLPYQVPNSGVVPTVVFLEPREGVRVEPTEIVLGPHQVTEVTITLSAPLETGYYRRYVVEHRYLAVLPVPIIRSLHAVHPWLPVVVIDALIAGGFLAVTLPLIGRGRVRSRDRERPGRGWSADSAVGSAAEPGTGSSPRVERWV